MPIDSNVYYNESLYLSCRNALRRGATRGVMSGGHHISLFTSLPVDTELRSVSATWPGRCVWGIWGRVYIYFILVWVELESRESGYVRSWPT